MCVLKAMLLVVASAAIALMLSTVSPAGPCGEVPYVGVCIPVGGEQPTPQLSLGEVT